MLRSAEPPHLPHCHGGRRHGNHDFANVVTDRLAAVAAAVATVTSKAPATGGVPTPRNAKRTVPRRRVADAATPQPTPRQGGGGGAIARRPRVEVTGWSGLGPAWSA